MSDLEKLAKELNKTKKSSFNEVGSVLVALALTIPCAFFAGWSLSLMWNWFLVPLLPAITWRAAVGVSLFIQFVLKPTPKTGGDISEFFDTLLCTMFYQLVFLGVSLVIYSMGFHFVTG